ncbi:glycosyltransferase family 39 protein [Extibacter muris]|uniref:glycosyltransferase family 39 protein n=1 Tax=Extibacter muris TaxID=1796622 RepID=UPI001D08EBD3|nr:glycosyltransferase family 39 protein [Extibacter muris]MCB6203662.1 glycosyltransferase family 39 protein [Extibacter muris]MCQ4665216.1 glycosyltransferase family 39 protein [Extibacter muris]MCQ4694630.1 glycosyltransferase family 39 protein [Extibacter muris]
MKKVNYKTLKQIVFLVTLVFTAVWFFPFMTKGIDVTDMAYYLVKYKYFFSPDLELKSLGTFFTDLLGSGIYHIRNSGQVMLLIICHWALYMGSGLIVYRCFRNYVQRQLLLLAILGGSFFSLTWVHVMNYNATSMFFQTLAICVLIKGIEQERTRYIVLSGVVIGINTFFRLPNILQISVGISILWYFAFCKKEVKVGFIRCIQFAGGVLGAWVAGGVLALFIVGKEEIISYLFQTTDTLGNAESSHGISSILSDLYIGAKEGIKDWFFWGSILLVVLVAWNCFIIWNKSREVKEKIVYFCVGIAIFLYGGYVGCRLEYLQFYQMIGVCILMLMLVGAFYYRKRKPLVSAVSVMTFCAEAVLSIGTNNGWNYQVVFLIFPLSVCILVVWSCKEEVVRKNVMFCTIFVASMALVVGARYATQYVYRDASNDQLKYAVNAKEYRGIYTSKERAEYIDELQMVLEPYNEMSLLTYGDFNIGCVITDMQPFISRIWVDLEGYSIESMKKDLRSGIKKRGYPVIVLADLDKNGVYRDASKLNLIESVILEGEYRLLYTNDYYKVYIPKSLSVK